MEKIYTLPVDKIPLSTEEKDVFQWLYPKKEVKENITNEDKTIIEKPIQNTNQKTKYYQFYVNVLCSFVLIFCSVYPKWNHFWKKLIPADESSIIFSLVKVCTVFFILYFINFMFHKYN